MVHNFEEVRTRTPADPNEAAPEAIMPQAAWEALLRDAVQGLRPPYPPPSPPPMAPGHPPPGLGHQRPPPHPTTTTPERGRARARGGQGTERDTQASRHGRTPSEGQAPIGTGHRRRHNVGAGNHPRTRKGQERGPRRRGRGHHGRRQDPHPGRAYHDGGASAAPPPANGAPLPGGAHPQHAPPKHESDAVRLTPAHTHQPPETTKEMGGTPTRGERATPTGEAAGNTAAQPTTTPSPAGDDPGHHKGHLTGTGRGQRHGHSTQG